MKRVSLIAAAALIAFAGLPAGVHAQSCPECAEYTLEIPDPKGGGGGGSDSGGAPEPESNPPAPEAAPSPAPTVAAPAEPIPSADPAPALSRERGLEARRRRAQRLRRALRREARQARELATSEGGAESSPPVISQPLSYEQAGPGSALTGQLGGAGILLLIACGAIGAGGFWLRGRSEGS